MTIDFDLFREACAIIDGVPEEKFNLDSIVENIQDEGEIGNPGHCGTTMCAMGTLALHPTFRGKGLSYDKTPFGWALLLQGSSMGYLRAAQAIFGMSIGEAMRLFEPSDMYGDHKKIFRQRVVDFLDKYDQPVNPEYRRLVEMED